MCTLETDRTQEIPVDTRTDSELAEAAAIDNYIANRDAEADQ